MATRLFTIGLLASRNPNLYLLRACGVIPHTHFYKICGLVVQFFFKGLWYSYKPTKLRYVGKWDTTTHTKKLCGPVGTVGKKIKIPCWNCNMSSVEALRYNAWSKNLYKFSSDRGILLIWYGPPWGSLGVESNIWLGQLPCSYQSPIWIREHPTNFRWLWKRQRLKSAYQREMGVSTSNSWKCGKRVPLSLGLPRHWYSWFQSIKDRLANFWG